MAAAHPAPGYYEQAFADSTMECPVCFKAVPQKACTKEGDNQGRLYFTCNHWDTEHFVQGGKSFFKWASAAPVRSAPRLPVAQPPLQPYRNAGPPAPAPVDITVGRGAFPTSSGAKRVYADAPAANPKPTQMPRPSSSTGPGPQLSDVQHMTVLSYMENLEHLVVSLKKQNDFLLTILRQVGGDVSRVRSLLEQPGASSASSSSLSEPSSDQTQWEEEDLTGDYPPSSQAF